MFNITNLTQPSAPAEVLDPRHLEFGRMFTPNFFVTEYRDGEWRNPRIQKLEPFVLHPASLVFHYAQTVFEGLKAYRQDSGRVVLFRPGLNAARFQQSAARLSIPLVDEAFFLEAIRALVTNERQWLPEAPGCFYIRPTVMGIDATLGVKSASEFIFYILTLPSGTYFKGLGEGPGAVDVLVSQSVVRTARGAMGNVKAGANYAGTLKITEEAKALGCSQVVFLDAEEHKYIEEMGGMNIMFVQKGCLRTPPLNTETILNGVTRDSLLVLAREMGLEVSEAPIAIDEVTAGLKSGEISEMFACGTAAVVVGLKTLRFEDGRILHENAVCPGPVTRRLYDTLTGVQYGRLPDRHDWVFEVCPADAGVPLPQPVGKG